MKVSLLTDAPKHNLALMKLSAWHKAQGNDTLLNMPILPADYRYASILFEKNKHNFIADQYGGPAINGYNLPSRIAKMKPDYDLYPHNDFSLGYTFRDCYRKCKFCKVPEMKKDFKHNSIWDFHDSRFKKIQILNNNTFFDKQWKETFEEIWDADLIIIEHGFDLRLIDEEKAEALRKTKFLKQIHYAWDRMKDEKEILRGLKIAPKGMVYVLIGFDTTEDEDLYRCQKIHDFGFDPFVMIYKRTQRKRDFQRFIHLRYYRNFKTIQDAWKDYEI